MGERPGRRDMMKRRPRKSGSERETRKRETPSAGNEADPHASRGRWRSANWAGNEDKHAGGTPMTPANSPDETCRLKTAETGARFQVLVRRFRADSIVRRAG